MARRSDPARGVAAILAVAVLIALVAIPAVAAPSAERAGSSAVDPIAAPTATPEPAGSPKPGKPPKAPKEPATPVTATGTVGSRTDAKGRTEYTLTSGSVVRVLSAGPPWFYGDDHPLKAYVGKAVTVTGSTRAGSDEIDVTTVDGTAIREPGKPPWAGGPKAVGSAHPGWSQAKADRWAAKRAEQMERHGVDCWPPGHCKDAPVDED